MDQDPITMHEVSVLVRCDERSQDHVRRWRAKSQNTKKDEARRKGGGGGRDSGLRRVENETKRNGDEVQSAVKGWRSTW